MTTTNPKNTKLLTLIVLLLIILLGAFYLLGNYNKPKPTTNNNQQNNNSSQELKPIISGWKVYENKEYGFRIDYPSEWKAEDVKAGDFPVYAVDFISPKFKEYNPARILFEENTSNLSLEEWVDKNKGSGHFEKGFLESKGFLPDYYIDEIILGGEKAFKTTFLSEGYFAPIVYKDAEYGPFYECGSSCDFDGEGVVVLKGNTIISIGAGCDMRGSQAQTNSLSKTAGMKWKVRILPIMSPKKFLPK